MKQKISYIIITILIITIIILTFFLVNNSRGAGYHLTGRLVDQKNSFTVNAFIMTNNKSNLINYYIDVPYHDTKIKYANLYYKENNKKQIFLGSSLSSYNYEERNYSIKEFNEKEDGADKLIKNINNIYVDLFESYEKLVNDEPYKTIKLTSKKFS